MKEDPRNHRPVSLTSVTGKVMDKIILGNTEKHLKDNTVNECSQQSFMRGKSCSSNLISFYDKLTHLADQGQTVDVDFLDFSEALNTVSHRMPLVKRSSTQLNKHIMQWVSNWLMARAQKGSILGLVLFNICINDIDKGTKCTLSKSADDTNLSGVANTPEGQDATWRDLDRLKKWAHGNLMRLNKTKYKVLHPGWGNPQYQYRLGDEQIKSSPAKKDLGVQVDVTLEHIAQGSCEYTMTGCIQGQVGFSSKQHSLVEGDPVHSRGVDDLQGPLQTQTIQ
ncbi:rna-directed dna polymerase from mobile element jockey-like [Willisornis vidua]|uniref:Rna-directed dna polymerase from mobile element jockey-like n=1 Tax=Willisornis vidua TaxID=1566151 RepID=A0ABQ9CTZ5_9PASS|nr:rna-directed dna polymerase from mobile element jockey-like [Willisornis vidua]